MTAVPVARLYAKDATIDELDLIANIGQNGLSGYFTFKSSVNTMGERATKKYNANKTNNSHQRLYVPENNFSGVNLSSGSTEIIDSGWYNVDQNVWLYLIRAIVATRNAGFNISSVQINSAFRSKYYNKYVIGVAESGRHSSGKALDIAMSGMSKSTGEEFIRQMYKNGFSSISYYTKDTFTHFDIIDRGPGAYTWGNNGQYTNVIEKELRLT